jgi:hypothetical protein
MRVESGWNIFSNGFLGSSIIPVIPLLLVGLAAWWASRRVDDWYENDAAAKSAPSTVGL